MPSMRPHFREDPVHSSLNRFGTRLAVVAGVTMVLLAACGAVAWGQVPILYYDFENNTTRATWENLVEQAINSGSGAITRAGNVTIVSSVGGAGTFNGGSATGQASTGNHEPQMQNPLRQADQREN